METGVKFRESNMREPNLTDPSDVLPYEIFTKCLMYVTVKELKRCSLVSQNWNSCTLDHKIWRHFCNQLWKNKVYIPLEIQDKKVTDPRKAYIESIIDSKRQYITEDELCAMNWSFRFKMAAGEDWTDHDPWWNGKRHSQSIFHKNGKSEFLKSDDLIDQNMNYSVGRLPERKWRWIESVAGRKGPLGSFLQINNYPPYIVSRSPTNNWGFIMQSCWVLLTSFDLPKKGNEPLLEDENLDVTTEEMQKEAMRYNVGIQFPFLFQANQQPIASQIIQFLQTNYPILMADDEDENDDYDYDEEGDDDVKLPRGREFQFNIEQSEDEEDVADGKQEVSTENSREKSSKSEKGKEEEELEEKDDGDVNRNSTRKDKKKNIKKSKNE